MGLTRDATQDDIKKAYRKLARQYHPDVSDKPDAEQLFKDLGEAYAVLKDPEKRAAYDELGSDWKAGQEFSPPPEWATGFEFSGPGFDGGRAEPFSDFFEDLFGSGRGRAHAGARPSYRASGEDHHARVVVDLEDAFQGGTRTIVLRTPFVDPNGHVVTKERKLNVKIPKGVRKGQRIRLAGQGSPGNGEAGDLYLDVDFRPHRLYRVDDKDVYLELPLTPWEAALGASIQVPTPSGPVDVTIPAGTQNDRKLRLRNRGIPSDPPGHMYIVATLTLPPASDQKSKDLYRRMREEMPYNPREHLAA